MREAASWAGIRETVSVANEAIFAAARKFPETKAC
jgi:hypothetical protein